MYTWHVSVWTVIYQKIEAKDELKSFIFFNLTEELFSFASDDCINA